MTQVSSWFIDQLESPSSEPKRVFELSDPDCDPLIYWAMDQSSWAGNSGDVLDSSGNGYIGMPENGASISSEGVINNCGVLDGTDDYLSLNDTDFPEVSSYFESDWSWSIWGFFHTFPNSPVGLIGKSTTGGGEGIDFGVTSTDVSFSVHTAGGADNNNSIASTSSLTLVQSVWYHFVVTKQGNDYSIYVQNSLVATGVESITLPTSDASIMDLTVGLGITSSGAGKIYHDGAVDEFIMYPHALTNSQVSNLYNEGYGNNAFLKIDYSGRVVKWPSIKKYAQIIKPRDVTVKLANHDGQFNFFHESRYTTVRSAYLKFGFTHPTSGDELISVFTGVLENIKYKSDRMDIRMSDKFWRLGDRKVGDSDSSIIFSSVAPSDIAWTLITCYGGFESVASTSNADVDWTSFGTWASIFSRDTILVSAHYDGQSITKALSGLAKYTESAIWNEGDGKIYFEYFEEMSSLDTTLTERQYTDLELILKNVELINKQWVYGNYSVGSEYWLLNVYDESSVSVNTYTLHENVVKDEHVWYVDSLSALTFAQRRTNIYDEPPKDLELKSSFLGIHRDMAETLRINSDVLGITSKDPWRIVEKIVQLNKGSVQFRLTQAGALYAFFLDTNYLDEYDLSVSYPGCAEYGDPRLL